MFVGATACSVRVADQLAGPRNQVVDDGVDPDLHVLAAAITMVRDLLETCALLARPMTTDCESGGGKAVKTQEAVSTTNVARPVSPQIRNIGHKI
jgi:hypothetical protein